MAVAQPLATDERSVIFRWKDYRVKDTTRGKTRHKTMTLTPQEFIRRFLLHVLPGGFHRIRHYGLLANGSRKQALAKVRDLLMSPAPVQAAVTADPAGTRLTIAQDSRIPVVFRY